MSRRLSGLKRLQRLSAESGFLLPAAHHLRLNSQSPAVAAGTAAGLVLLPARFGLDGKQQVADLALLHPDLAVAVREGRKPVPLAELGNVVVKECDVPDVLRRGQPDFL